MNIIHMLERKHRFDHKVLGYIIIGLLFYYGVVILMHVVAYRTGLLYRGTKHIPFLDRAQSGPPYVEPDDIQANALG